MRVLTSILFAFAGIGFGPLTSADAATVTYYLFVRDSPGGNTFEVYAEASEGDNGGIAEYRFPVVGPVVTLDHQSPMAPLAQDALLQSGPAGFTASRSVDGNLSIAAAQDGANPAAHMIYGLGQSAGSFGESGVTPIGLAEQPAWNKKLLIAKGTHNAPDYSYAVAAGGSPSFANVFVAPGSRETMRAQLIISVDRVPEPTASELMAVCAATLLGSARRGRAGAWGCDYGEYCHAA
jgi:hypothetical protein